MIIITQTPNGGYLVADTGNEDREVGFADTSGAPTIMDVQRKLEARGITHKAMKEILQDLATKGEVVIPLA